MIDKNAVKLAIENVKVKGHRCDFVHANIFAMYAWETVTKNKATNQGCISSVLGIVNSILERYGHAPFGRSKEEWEAFYAWSGLTKSSPSNSSDAKADALLAELGM